MVFKRFKKIIWDLAAARDAKSTGCLFWSISSLPLCWACWTPCSAGNAPGGEGVLTTIYGVLIFLPWWAVQFRRLHDTDRSAWWLLLLLIPIIGWLIIIAFNCQNGTPGDNRFGPDPKRFS